MAELGPLPGCLCSAPCRELEPNGIINPPTTTGVAPIYYRNMKKYLSLAAATILLVSGCADNAGNIKIANPATGAIQKHSSVPTDAEISINMGGVEMTVTDSAGHFASDTTTDGSGTLPGAYAGASSLDNDDTTSTDTVGTVATITMPASDSVFHLRLHFTETGTDTLWLSRVVSDSVTTTKISMAAVTGKDVDYDIVALSDGTFSVLLKTSPDRLLDIPPYRRSEAHPGIQKISGKH